MILKDGIMQLDETHAQKIYADLDVQKSGKANIGKVCEGKHYVCL